MTTLDDYKKAIEIDPNDADAYYKRGFARYMLGHNQGALDDLNKAIKLNLNDVDAYSIRGIVRFEMGDEQGGTEDYNQASSILGIGGEP